VQALRAGGEELRPDAPWGYSARGLGLALLKRFPEAERELKEAVRRWPDFSPARLNLGVARWLQKDYDGAVTYFTAVLEALPDKKHLQAAYVPRQPPL